MHKPSAKNGKQTYKNALMKIVAPPLAERGYQYEPSLEDGIIVFGFAKAMGDHLEARVLFYRRQFEERPVRFDFDIRLERTKVPPAKEDERLEYDGYLNERLGAIMAVVNGKIDYGASGWHAADQAELESSLRDAAGAIEQYGIPWLEDPKSRTFGHISVQDKKRFRQALLDQVAPRLGERGYVAVEDKRSLPPYFRKALQNGISAFVRFDQSRWPKSPKISFRVRLETMNSDTLFPKLDLPDQDLRIPMPKLMGDLGDFVTTPGAATDDRIKRGEWEYDSIDKLESQLRQALQVLEKVALDWLEDPASRNPWEPGFAFPRSK